MHSEENKRKIVMMLLDNPRTDVSNMRGGALSMH